MTRNDGCLDAWDLYYRQSSEAFKHQVSDVPLTAVACQASTIEHGGGRLIAVGDANGAVTLIELSENLATPSPPEKNAIGLMFERESTREEILEKRAQALARAARAAKAPVAAASPSPRVGDEAGDAPEASDPEIEEALKDVVSKFEALLGVLPAAAAPVGGAGAAAIEPEGEGAAATVPGAVAGDDAAAPLQSEELPVAALELPVETAPEAALETAPETAPEAASELQAEEEGKEGKEEDATEADAPPAAAE